MECSNLSTFSPTLVIIFLEKNNFSLTVGVKWYLIVVLICISLMTDMISSIFSWAFGPFASCLWRKCIQIHSSFQWGYFIVLLLSCLYWKSNLRIFYPILWLSFHLLDGFLWSTAFNLSEVQIILLVVPVCWVLLLLTIILGLPISSSLVFVLHAFWELLKLCFADIL